MGTLDGRVAVVTGAARGIGREHARCLAGEGARVVVNDLDGADDVAAEIREAGGEAVPSGHDCADWEGGRALVALAIESFGRLDVLVNNAGAIRDRAIVTMEEDDWDHAVRVNLKGHYVPTRWAAQHWRERSKAGEALRASLIHTTSTSGLFGNPGQANYGAAKAGIALFSTVCAHELGRYGVRSNCIAPAARTRLTDSVPGLAEMVAAPADDRFDVWHPANASPLVAYLASASCPFTGATFYVQGGTIRVMEPWRIGVGVEREARWTVGELADALAPLAST